MLYRMAAALAAAILFMTPCAAAECAGAAPQLSARSAILVDAASGRVLYEKNADERSRIASTTKILTGLIVCESLPLNREVTVPPEAVGIEGSSMYLQAGERISIRALLYGMLLRSGNDAATALAILCSGSVAQFAQRMNQRAAALGMENSHFCNPSGLDEDGHFSTARDLALLSRAAMKNLAFREAVGTKNAVFGTRALSNHNKLLWSYPGANGIKTGYTRAAGRILVSSAERAGHTLIAVTICDANDWADHTALLDYGFSAFEWRCFLRSGEKTATVDVVGGICRQAALCAAESLVWPMKAGETAELRMHAPHFVFAPVLRGPAGYAALCIDGEMVGTVPLYYRQPVAAAVQKGLLARLFGG